MLFKCYMVLVSNSYTGCFVRRVPLTRDIEMSLQHSNKIISNQNIFPEISQLLETGNTQQAPRTTIASTIRRHVSLPIKIHYLLFYLFLFLKDIT